MVLIFGSRLKSERVRDHGEEGTNAVSYEPAADKTRHQGETLRWTPFDMQEPAQYSLISVFNDYSNRGETINTKRVLVV